MCQAECKVWVVSSGAASGGGLMGHGRFLLLCLHGGPAKVTVSSGWLAESSGMAHVSLTGRAWGPGLWGQKLGNAT